MKKCPTPPSHNIAFLPHFEMVSLEIFMLVQASFNGKEFDNCFATANAYYYRVGSDSILRVRILVISQPMWNMHNLLSLSYRPYSALPSNIAIFRPTCPALIRLSRWQGLDLAVQSMRVGDLWKLTVPASLAFGEKGTKASAGKPRIPGAPPRRQESKAAREGDDAEATRARGSRAPNGERASMRQEGDQGTGAVCE
jgi:hypothetical protein